MTAPKIDYLGASGGVYVRQLHFAKAGDTHQGHTHQINHVTLVQRGKLLCEVEGRPPLELTAPSWITIDKGTLHKFTALEDDSCYFCIFSLYDETGQINLEGTGDKILGECFSCPAACNS